MSEHKLREAFENLNPSDESRRRMFNNIMAAQEQKVAAADERVVLDVTAKDKKVLSLHVAAQPHDNNSVEEAAQPHDNNSVEEVAQSKTTADTHKYKRKPKKFSFIRYALPAAACLLLAAIVPLSLPQLVSMYEDQGAVQSDQGAVQSEQGDEPSSGSFEVDVRNDASYGAGSLGDSTDDESVSEDQTPADAPDVEEPAVQDEEVVTPSVDGTEAPSSTNAIVTVEPTYSMEAIPEQEAASAEAVLPSSPSGGSVLLQFSIIEFIGISIALVLICAAGIILWSGLRKRRSIKQTEERLKQ